MSMASSHDDHDVDHYEDLIEELMKALDNVDKNDLHKKLKTDFEFVFLALQIFLSAPAAKATIPSEDVTHFLNLLDGQHILAQEWKYLREDLRSDQPMKIFLAVNAHSLFRLLMKDVIAAGYAFWFSELSSEYPNYNAMKSAPYHAARMLGLFNRKDKRDALSVWTELEDEVPKEEYETWTAIHVSSLACQNPTKLTWKYVAPALQHVYTSKPFLHQVSLLIKIFEYLGSFPDGWPEGLQDPLQRNQLLH